MKTLTCTLVALLALAWPSAAAVALDLTFDDVMSVGNPLVTMLDTHGYRFTGSFRTIDAPGGMLASNGSSVYLGQEASGPGITLTRADRGPFRLYGFDAAGLYAAASPGSPNAQHVSLVGLRAGGGILSASYGLGDLAQFTHFGVPGAWNDVQAVTFTGLLSATSTGALALDNMGVGEGPTPVAEPMTLMQVALTALGAGGLALARRRHNSFRPR